VHLCTLCQHKVLTVQATCADELSSLPEHEMSQIRTGTLVTNGIVPQSQHLEAGHCAECTRPFVAKQRLRRIQPL
jgi:hypothetical protein